MSNLSTKPSFTPTNIRKADAHARRVTLNLAQHSQACPEHVCEIVSRLEHSKWDWKSLPKNDLEQIYASLDAETTTEILGEWNVDSRSIRDWGHPYDKNGMMYSWWRDIGKGERETDCKLCGHKHNRFEFLATNSENGSEMWMGSTCITKYQFTVDGEAVAESALDLLRAQMNKSKRKQTAAEWKEAHPTADLQIAELTFAMRQARRQPRWGTRPDGKSYWAWNEVRKDFLKPARAITKYYDKHGYLTPQRTSSFMDGGAVMRQARYIVSVWKGIDDARNALSLPVTSKPAPAPAKANDVATFWKAFLEEYGDKMTRYETKIVTRKIKWGDSWDDLRDWERKILEAVKGVEPVVVAETTSETSYGGSDQSFIERRRNRKAAGTTVAKTEIVSDDDLPWNQ